MHVAGFFCLLGLELLRSSSIGFLIIQGPVVFKVRNGSIAGNI